MNAAARLVHQGSLSQHFMLSHLISCKQIGVMILTALVFMSAFGVIYVTNMTRALHASLQHNLTEQDRLHVEHGQLLLERGAWMMQARIQQIAEKQLGMVIPDHKSVVIVRE